MPNTNTKLTLTAPQMRKMVALYHDYTHIENDSDLRKRRLHLNDYQAIPGLANSIQRTGEVRTFLDVVANYFKRFGFTVTMDENNVNYIISF